ncbi:MAG: ribonuclease HI [Candidatus Midichloriaceae bacterium]|jgi:ribonuclease HI
MIIFCDGSCLGNPGAGGWAAIYIKNETIIKQISGYQKDTTNNRMELTAAIEAFKNLSKEVKSLDIYTDSTYVKNGITDWINSWKVTDWKKGKVKNIQLWKELDILNSKLEVRWHWVKAHNGNKYNEIVDTLARNAAENK